MAHTVGIADAGILFKDGGVVEVLEVLVEEVLVDYAGAFGGALLLGADLALGDHGGEEALQEPPLPGVLPGVHKFVDGLRLVLDGEEDIVLPQKFSAFS